MMRQWMLILACLTCSHVEAAENIAADKATVKQAPVKKQTPAAKQPSKMEKAGNSLKSGWKKFTHDVKQGVKKPACTPAQRSINQCK